MTAQEQPRGFSALNWKRWLAVKSWPKVSGEARLAWWDLFFEFGPGKPGAITTSAAAIAGRFGRDSRSGARAFESLADKGLIVIIDRPTTKRKRVPWVIYLNDPLTVAADLPRPACPGDGQVALFETAGDEPQMWDNGSRNRPPIQEESADVAQQPPIRRPRLQAHAHGDLDLRLRKSPTERSATERSEVPIGGFCATSADGGRRPGDGEIEDLERTIEQRRREAAEAERRDAIERATPIAVQMERILRATASTADQRFEQMRALSAKIYGAVGDRRLYQANCDELASAVLDGRWQLKYLVKVISQVQKTCGEEMETPRGVPRFGYFLQAARNSMAERDERNR